MKLYAIGIPGHEKPIYDLVVVSSGYESRARYVTKKCQPAASKKIAFGFTEHAAAEARVENDKFLHEQGYEIHQIGGNSSLRIEGVFGEALDDFEKSEVRVLVDITSMTRAWYGGLVKALHATNRKRKIVVDFYYAPAKYIKPTNEYPPNEIVGPVAGFSALSLPDRPTVLIVGIGQEKGRAIGLLGYLDPSEICAFVPKPSVDRRYEKDVFENNSPLIMRTPDEAYFEYDIKDPVDTFKKLESVVVGYKRGWRIVMASFGPKLFSLCCFLVAGHYKDVSVWRVSAAGREEPTDRKPNGDIIVLRTEWILENYV